MLSSLICLVGGAGAGDLVGGGDCWDCGAEKASQVQSFKILEHFACTHL